MSFTALEGRQTAPGLYADQGRIQTNNISQDLWYCHHQNTSNELECLKCLTLNLFYKLVQSKAEGRRPKEPFPCCTPFR